MGRPSLTDSAPSKKVSAETKKPRELDEPQELLQSIEITPEPAKEKKLNKQKSRVGKVHVGGYYPKEVKGSIRLIQAVKPDVQEEELVAEALNDLFAKYNVPQTAPVREAVNA